MSAEPNAKDLQHQLTIAAILAESDSAGIDLESGRQSTNDLLGNRDALVDGNERYDISDVLAKGGMGMVVAARDLNIRRKVAVKMMLGQGQQNRDALIRFVEEAQVTGQLEHPNIVPVHELGVRDDGQVFYSMKMIRGRDLSMILEEIKKGVPETVAEFPLSRLITIFMKVCDAVAFAHSRKVIHRDLKPANVMIGDFGEVLVVDWGLAKVLKSQINEAVKPNASDLDDELVESIRSADDSGQLLTMAGQVMGTPRFMAPEQALGQNSDVDCRCDIYALGAILYNLLSLESHVEANTVTALLLDVVNGKHVPIYERGKEGGLPHCRNGRIPVGLQAVVEKCLQVDPGERYQSVQELQTDVEAWQGGFATGAEQAGFFREAALLVARNKAVVAVTMAALLILGVLGSLSVREIVAQRDQANQARLTADKERATAEAALREEALARRDAEKARADAVAQRQVAEDARSDALRALDRAEQNSYYHMISAAAGSLQAGVLRDMDDPLAQCPPERRRWEWDFLRQASVQSVQTIKVHRSCYSVVISPRNRNLAVVSVGQFGLRLVDLSLSEEIRAFTRNGVRLGLQFAFSSDADRLYCGAPNGAVVWHVDTAKPAESVSWDTGDAPTNLSMSADGRLLALAYGDGGRGEGAAKIALFDAATHKQLWEYELGPGWPPEMAFDPTGKWLACGGYKEAVQVFDVATGKPTLAKEEKLSSRLGSLRFSPDSRYLITAGTAGITVLKAPDWRPTTAVELYVNHGNEMTFTPDGRHCVVGSRNDVYFVDLETGKAQAVYRGHAGDVTACTFNGNTLVTACKGGELRVWPERTAFYPFQEMDVHASRLHFVKAGNGLLVAQKSLSLWDPSVPESPRPVNSWSTDRQWVHSLDVDDAKNLVVATGAGGTARIWNYATDKLVRELQVSDKGMAGASFSRDTRQLFTCDREGDFGIWDLASGKRIKTFTHEGFVGRIILSPDDKHVLLLSQSNLTVRNAETFALVRRIELDSSNRRDLCFSPDGSLCAVVSKRAFVFKTSDWSQTHVFSGNPDHLSCAAFSPDGERLLTAGYGTTLNVHAVKDGRTLMNVPCNGSDRRSPVYAIAFAPDGKTLALGKNAHTLIFTSPK